MGRDDHYLTWQTSGAPLCDAQAVACGSQTSRQSRDVYGCLTACSLAALVLRPFSKICVLKALHDACPPCVYGAACEKTHVAPWPVMERRSSSCVYLSGCGGPEETTGTRESANAMTCVSGFLRVYHVQSFSDPANPHAPSNDVTDGQERQWA